MLNTHEHIPPFGQEVLLWYKERFFLGYAYNFDGSMKPRKWHWHINGYGELQDLVEWWHPLPEDPKGKQDET